MLLLWWRCCCCVHCSDTMSRCNHTFEQTRRKDPDERGDGAMAGGPLEGGGGGKGLMVAGASYPKVC